jgi:bacteriophage exclusion system BrxC/D-like protein
MSEETESIMYSRRVIEALRNGVPSRDAVRTMGSNQDEVEQLFLQKIEQLPEHLAAGRQLPGLLVSGDFGTGKSHLLEYLEDQALTAGLVCSRVVISKETPLYDAAKLYRAAVDSAVVPGRTGRKIQEAAYGLHHLRETDAYAFFRQWCNSSGISALFPATLYLYERLENEPELVEAIVNFWFGEPLGSGDRLSMKKVRDALRAVGGTSLFQFNAVPARQLAFERFRFTARMLTGAGYKGWVMLLDEVELIGRYSFLQRAKSYGELARWMGLLRAEHYPGLLTVAAISADFDPPVLSEKGKGDFSSVRPKLESRGTEEYRLIAARADLGMRLIRSGAIELKVPDKLTVEQTYQRLKQLHARAYAWQPPEIPRPEPSLLMRMRKLVRRWINEWDLRRLYGDVPISMEERELAPSYAEDPQLEAISKNADEP